MTKNEAFFCTKQSHSEEKKSKLSTAFLSSILAKLLVGTEKKDNGRLSSNARSTGARSIGWCAVTNNPPTMLER